MRRVTINNEFFNQFSENITFGYGGLQMQKKKDWICFCILVTIFMSYNALGEVVFDGSMNSSTEDMKLTGDMNIISDYGSIKGNNLFHSFKTFNVNLKESVTFSSQQAVKNIIARVTGGQFSTINGAVKSDANLYLMNPQGIIFKEGASIEIDGSFYATTADYISSNDVRFSSLKTIENDLLFTGNPTSFGFLSGNPQKIEISGKWEPEEQKPEEQNEDDAIKETILVESGNKISLIAGEFEISNANLSAEQGTIHLASVSSKGVVVLNDLDQSDDCLKGNIQISQSQLDVSGDGSGDIFIRGGRIVINNKSTIKADNTGSAKAGKIDIKATTFTIDYSNIYSDAKSTGDGGQIYINADQSIVLMNSSQILADVDNRQTGAGNAGTIALNSEQIQIINKSIVSSDTYGDGQGGMVKMIAEKAVFIQGECKIFTVAEGKGEHAGNGGLISIQSPNITISQNSLVSTDTMYGNGNGGKISLSGIDDTPSESITIFDSKIYSGAIAIDGVGDGGGDGGEIHIKGKSVSIINGGVIDSISNGKGRGGDVKIESSELVFWGYGSNKDDLINYPEAMDNTSDEDNKIQNSAIYTKTESNLKDAGNAGDINITSDIIRFQDESQLNANTKGPGNAGKIVVKASIVELVDDSSISSASTGNNGAGDGGEIKLTAASSLNLNHSNILTSSKGDGNAGKIEIEASMVELVDDSSISSASEGIHDAGDGGTIIMEISSKLNLNHANILTSSEGDGNAGQISILAKGIYLSNQSGIRSESKASINGGTAGQITVMADDILDINNSDISTEAKNTSKDIVDLTKDKENGRMEVCAKKKLQMINGTITTSVLGGMGNGGDIDIDPDLILMFQSQIIANAYEGNGGNIHIVADNFIQSADSIVQASSQYGLDGDIFIDAPDARISNELVTLPTNYLDATQWLRTPCSLRTSKDVSRLVLSGRDAIPSTVDDLYMSPALTFLPDDGTDPLRKGKLDADFFDEL